MNNNTAGSGDFAPISILENIHASLPQRIFVKDADLLYRYANAVYAADFGLRPGEMEGKDDFALHPTQTAAKYHDDDLKVLSSGASLVCVEKYLPPGKDMWVRTTKMPYRDREGKIIGVLGIFEDISAEQRLDEENRRSSAIMEATPDIVSTASPDGRLTYLNSAGRKILGISPDGGIDGLRIPDLHPAWAYRIIQEQALPGAASEGLWSGHTALKGADGGEVPVSQIVMAHRDPEGAVEYFSTIMRDLSEREELERTLLLAKKAIDKAVVGIAFGDTEGVLTYVNDAFLSLWGDGVREDFLGKSALDFWDRREEAGMVVQAITRDGYWTGEMKARRPDGTAFDALLSASVIRDEDGSAVSLMATFIDISEKKKIEAEVELQARQFRVLKQTSLDAFWLVDREGFIIDWNETACRMLGYDPDEFRGKSIIDIEAVERPEETEQHIAKILENGSDIFDSRHRKKSGDIIDVEVSASLCSEQGYIISFIRDITERLEQIKELERLRGESEKLVAVRTGELVLALRRAEHADKAKSAFLSRMSHELRTPLNAIIGFSQLLKMQGPVDLRREMDESLEEILKAGNHLLSLIDAMLEFSSTSSMEQYPKMAAFDTFSAVRECIDGVREQAEQRSVRIYEELEADAVIIADRERFRHALLCVLKNAVQYNREGGEVAVNSFSRDQRFILTVRDSGAGIPEELHERIFEPFERIEDIAGSSAGAPAGLGMGLPTARQLLAEMGGSIGVESAPGKGSLFRLELPVRPADGPAERKSLL